MSGHFLVGTPSSSYPTVPMPVLVLSAVTLNSLLPYLSLPTSLSFTKLVPA